MRKIGLLLLSLSLLNYPLYGIEESKANDVESEFIQAGDRAVDQEEQMLEKEKRAQKDEEYKEEGMVAQSVYYTSHPAAYHTFYRNWDYGMKVELNDGSIWSVASKDQWKVNTWYSTDIILIKQNFSFFSPYDYELVNQRCGDRVDVNLLELEILPYDSTFFGQRSWVISIDYFNNIVTLQDGSVWTVSFDDDSTLATWRLGDVVIIGVNDGWDNTIRPNLLINFNTLNDVRANCVN